MKSRICFSLCLLMSIFMAQEVWAAPKVTTVSSVEYCEAKFARWHVTKPKNGIEFFVGRRKGLNPKYQVDNNILAERNILRFDRTKLEVGSVLTDEQQARLMKADNDIWGLTVDEQGQQIAVIISSKKENGGIILDIAVIDARNGEVRYRLADGQRNYAPSFSPDGRHLAYYSTDPDMDLKPDVPIKHSAGRVIDLTTGRVTTFTGHFMDKNSWMFGDPPRWLDNARVLYRTFCTDASIIAEQAKSFAGVNCPCTAVAYIDSGKTKFLLLPLGISPPLVFVDSKREKIVMTDQESVIVMTDFNLDQKTTICELDNTKKLKVHGINEDGTVKYTIKEKVKETVPASLF